MDQISLWDFAEDFNKKMEEKRVAPVSEAPAVKQNPSFSLSDDENEKKYKYQGALIPSWVSLDPDYLLKNFVHEIYHEEPLSVTYIKRRKLIKNDIDYENPIEVNRILKNWIFDISSTQFFSQYKDFTFPDECYFCWYAKEFDDRDTYSIDREKAASKEEFDLYTIHRIGPNYKDVLATFTSAEVLKALLSVTYKSLEEDA